MCLDNFTLINTIFQQKIYLSFRKNSHSHILFPKTYPQIKKNCENIRNLLTFCNKIKLPNENPTKQKEKEIPYGLFYNKYLQNETKNFNFFK